MLHALSHVLSGLWSNWLSLAGTALTTIAANVILIYFVMDVVATPTNPYARSLAYLVMPALFVVGLLLIAVGAWRARKSPGSQVIRDAVSNVLAHKPTRRRIWFVAIGTGLNVTIVSVAAYKAFSYTNSQSFCGELCHSVMAPEFRSYKLSAHARVPCADCHIGEGASWFVRSKLSGLAQVWAVTRGDFSRPIQTPLHNLRPAPETCEKCHWPAKFHGERLLVRHTYADDEKSTRRTNVVRLKVGGMDKRRGRYTGIHWHVSPEVKITYEALDYKRAKVGRVTVVEQGRPTRVFEPKKRDARVVERRTMDCLDCHNRPSHTFDPRPEVAVDRALTYGKLDVALPFIRREAVKLLRDTKVDPQQAAARYAAALKAFYASKYPAIAAQKEKAIARSARELSWIYQRNVYPSMKIAWNTYPLHIGHRTTVEGCFRCHDDEHSTKAGQTIAQDCDQCHEVLAEEEEKPDVPEAVLKLGDI